MQCACTKSLFVTPPNHTTSQKDRVNRPHWSTQKPNELSLIKTAVYRMRPSKCIWNCSIVIWDHNAPRTWTYIQHRWLLKSPSGNKHSNRYNRAMHSTREVILSLHIVLHRRAAQLGSTTLETPGGGQLPTDHSCASTHICNLTPPWNHLQLLFML